MYGSQSSMTFINIKNKESKVTFVADLHNLNFKVKCQSSKDTSKVVKVMIVVSER